MCFETRVLNRNGPRALFDIRRMAPGRKYLRKNEFSIVQTRRLLNFKTRLVRRIHRHDINVGCADTKESDLLGRLELTKMKTVKKISRVIVKI